MSESEKSDHVVVATIPRGMSGERTRQMVDALKDGVKDTGATVLFFPEEMRPQLSPDVSALVDEQKRTNELLALLIQALADEADPDDPPTTYLDGTPAR